MANYLNDVLLDVPLQDVKERILAEMATDKALYDSLVKLALQLGNRILDESPSGEGVFLGDPSSLFDQPEFASVGQMKTLFEAFEKKGLILKLLERASEAKGIQIFIGEENRVPDLRNCTIVSASFGEAGSARGSVGVIGPTRMEYGRVVGLVEYTAQLLTEVLASL
jgi:heat-inducible transcriptional repressor